MACESSGARACELRSDLLCSVSRLGVCKARDCASSYGTLCACGAWVCERAWVSEQVRARAARAQSVKEESAGHRDRQRQTETERQRDRDRAKLWQCLRCTHLDALVFLWSQPAASCPTTNFQRGKPETHIREAFDVHRGQNMASTSTEVELGCGV
eukprot:1970408-Rhodomonas_salina.2